MSTVVVLDEHRYSNHAMNDNKDELVEIENEREREREGGQKDLVFFAYETFLYDPKCEIKVIVDYVNSERERGRRDALLLASASPRAISSRMRCP